MRLLTVALALLALGHGPARGGDLEAAQALYEQGAFEKAADLARVLGSADGHALAARATLVEALYLAPDDEKLALLEVTVEDARTALDLAPEHVSAHLELAVALGEAAKLRNPLTVHMNGYVGESRRHLDRALRLDPESAWTHAMLGAWHLQVVGHAGVDLALELYGAELQAGLALCRDAATLAPDGLLPRFACAVSLLELDAGTYGGEVAQTLALITELPAQDATERLIQDRARDLLEAMGWDASN